MPTPESPENLEARREALFEKLQLKEQYASQFKVLGETGILETLPELQDLGVVGIDGKEYPLPSLKDVKERISDTETIELMEKKAEQGYNKLLLVPFAMPFNILSECHKKFVQTKFELKEITDGSGKLLDIPDGYNYYVDFPEVRQGDATGDFLYRPSGESRLEESEEERKKLFKTKGEMIEGGSVWEVHFFQDNAEIPQEDCTNGDLLSETVSEYLEGMKNPQREGEKPLTPEAWVVFAMTKLQESGIQIDTVHASALLGATFPKAQIPVGYYDPDDYEVAVTTASLLTKSGWQGFRNSVKL
ncbi:hypothetical protein ACFL2D_00840 [Patescibacteria group bacterium]